MVGSSDTLANGSEVNLRGNRTRGKWELGDGKEGGCAFPSAVKFRLQVKLDHFHIAQGHADVSVSHHLHKRWQADPKAHHLGCEGVTKPVRIDPTGAARALVKKFVSDKVQFFSTNSTIQSWGCVKREKVLNPGGRWGLWNCARMRLTDEKGGAMGQASWRSSFLGQRSAKFLPETRAMTR